MNLTAKIGVLYNITASADGKYQWATVSGDMGYVEITVNDVSANQAREGDTVVVKAISKIFNFRNTDFYDAKLDHWVVDGVANLTDSELKNPELTFTMPANAVSLKAVFVKTGSQVTLTANFNETASELGLSLGQAIEIARTCDDENRQHLHDSVEDTFISGAEVSAFLLSVENPNTNIKLVRWEITNTTTDEPVTVRYETWGSPLGGNYDRPYFTVDGTSNYTIKAIFAAKDYGDVNVTVNDESMGTATAQIGTEEAAASIKAVVEGTEVKLQAQPKTGYVFQSWSATYGSDNTPVNIANSTAAQTTFVMPPTNRQPVKVVAEFAVDPSYLSEDCALTDVTLLDNNDSSISYNGDMDGTDFTIEVPADTDNAKLANMILKLTYSENAQVFRDGSDTPWNANGQACNMTLGTRTKFVVRSQKDLAEGYEGPKRAYTITINCAKSTECAIESAKLGDVDGVIDQTEKTVTFTVPADTEDSAVATMPLTFNCSQDASIKLKDAEADWDNGTACNMSLNTPVKFIITAEDNTPKTYTVEIKYTAPNAPTLSDGSAARSSKTGATVKFTSSEAGNYFYKVVDHGATAPTVEEIKKSTTKGTASAGETTFTLSNLTTDARDVYIIVVSAAGSESAPLKVEIPAYDSGSDTPSTGAYKISVTTPKGGTITTNRTKADAGDEIIVTVIPDDGYQMEADSLTYTLAKDKGETVKITGNKFTMPACDVTITCKWETATTTAKGITSFSISGVVGAVNNTTNTITITLPRGTDVTKLTPVIATNGVKSLTPGSGETVDFTNAVTYTAAMEDGSSKTYTVTVYVDKGTLADQFWDKLTDFATQVPWWEYAKHQQSTSKYPKYW